MMDSLETLLAVTLPSKVSSFSHLQRRLMWLVWTSYDCNSTAHSLYIWFLLFSIVHESHAHCYIQVQTFVYSYHFVDFYHRGRPQFTFAVAEYLSCFHFVTIVNTKSTAGNLNLSLLHVHICLCQVCTQGHLHTSIQLFF